MAKAGQNGDLSSLHIAELECALLSLLIIQC